MKIQYHDPRQSMTRLSNKQAKLLFTKGDTLTILIGDSQGAFESGLTVKQGNSLDIKIFNRYYKDDSKPSVFYIDKINKVTIH